MAFNPFPAATCSDGGIIPLHFEPFCVDDAHSVVEVDEVAMHHAEDFVTGGDFGRDEKAALGFSSGADADDAPLGAVAVGGLWEEMDAAGGACLCRELLQQDAVAEEADVSGVEGGFDGGGHGFFCSGLGAGLARATSL